MGKSLKSVSEGSAQCSQEEVSVSWRQEVEGGGGMTCGQEREGLYIIGRKLL